MSRPTQSCACKHRRRRVVEELGGALDDHRTKVVTCRDCGAGFVVTRWLTHDHSERRRMTLGEQARYAGVRA